MFEYVQFCISSYSVVDVFPIACYQLAMHPFLWYKNGCMYKYNVQVHAILCMFCSYEKKNDILIRSLCCTCIIYHSSEFMTTYFFFKGGVIPSQDRGKNQDSRGTEALVGGWLGPRHTTETGDSLYRSWQIYL